MCNCYTAHTHVLFFQSEEFEVYNNYAGTYMSAVTALEDMLNLKTEAVKYLKVSYACSLSTNITLYLYTCLILFIVTYTTRFVQGSCAVCSTQKST